MSRKRKHKQSYNTNEGSMHERRHLSQAEFHATETNDPRQINSSQTGGDHLTAVDKE